MFKVLWGIVGEKQHHADVDSIEDANEVAISLYKRFDSKTKDGTYLIAPHGKWEATIYANGERKNSLEVTW